MTESVVRGVSLYGVSVFKMGGWPRKIWYNILSSY